MVDIVHAPPDLFADRQHSRLLRLSFPHHDGPSGHLLVNRIEAREFLSRDFDYSVEFLSDDANLELKSMLGRLLCIALVRLDGTLRYFTGYCFSFRLRKTDGALAYYDAELGPWMKYLGLRRDNYLFHQRTLRDQSSDIFDDYAGIADWDWRVAGGDVAMSDACQFDESDHNYLSRRWEAAGFFYWYEHTESGHKLILSDDSCSAPWIDGIPHIAFQRQGGAVEEDGIGEWSPRRRLVPARVTVSAFNFKNPTRNLQNLWGVPTTNQQGAATDIESYEYLGAYGVKGSEDGDRIARLRMEEIEAGAKWFEGVGNNRQVMPGRCFRLTGHFDDNPFGDDSLIEQNEFLLTGVHHVASNNYLQDADQQSSYSNSITCIRKHIPWRPGRGYDSVGTRILAPQTAIVVGPDGPDSIHVDKYGRIRVQFHWDRAGTYDEGSSAWVRVMSLWAGSELGAAAIPRVGSEVCVLFLDGNPDRPAVVAAVPNEGNMPPWALPAQHALSGLRSRELRPGSGNAAAGRSNHLILDDTHQGIQAQIKSDHAHSTLSLGKIARIDDNAGRKEVRGEGWELASEAWGVARAGKGMLLTTESRPGGASPIKDLDETAGRLRTASELHAQMVALAGKAQEEKSGGADVANALHQQAATVQGEGADAFPELGEPHLVLASPAGIELTTAQSIHIASDHHAAITTGKKLSMACKEGLFASVGNAFRVFVHKAGMKLVAASGKVQIEAHSDNVEIIASKVLALLSESDWVEIRGKKGIRLHGANSMLEISAMTQCFTPAPVLFHGGCEKLPPKPVSQAINEREGSRFDQEVRLLDSDGMPAPKIVYELMHEDGHRVDGETGGDGSTQVQKGDGMDSYTIRYRGELP